jgi:hypothetical protein
MTRTPIGIKIIKLRPQVTLHTEVGGGGHTAYDNFQKPGPLEDFSPPKFSHLRPVF